MFGAYEVYNRHRKIPKVRGRIQVVYGRCLRPDEYDPGKGADERFQVAINRIMDAIATLVVPEKRNI